MEDFQLEVERRTPYKIKLVDQRYITTSLQGIKEILDAQDAVESRLDRESFQAFLDNVEQEWEDDSQIACVVLADVEGVQVPVAIAIATRKDYRDGVRRPMELNWERTNAYRNVEEQWCIDYVVRARAYRGSGVGGFALVGLLECFGSRYAEGMLWLQLAGGFGNRSALSLYTDVGFLVTSLDSQKNPIMSLQAQDIGQRARRKVSDILTLRYGPQGGDDGNNRVGRGRAGDEGGAGGAGGGGDREGDARGGDDGAGGARGGDDGGGPGGGDEDDWRNRLRARRQRRRRRRINPADNERERRDPQQEADQRRRQCLERLRFRTAAEHLKLVSGQLVVPPQAMGMEREQIERLDQILAMTSINPNSQSLLIHLNAAKQCHYISASRQQHVSRWIADQRQENRENVDLTRKFATLASDVLLLWNVLRMPCLALLEMTHTAASRRGGLRDIVSACDHLINEGQPFPPTILIAQQEMHRQVSLLPSHVP